MWLVRSALRRPVTILVAVIAIALCSILALQRMPVDIFPNLGAPAIEMGKSGATGHVIEAGDVVWKGACTLVAGATIPYFGFGLKMFAFATSRPGTFHLRCGDAGLFEIMRSTPAAFRGEYFSDHVRDFMCDRVAIELDRESAIEAGGELLGRRSRIELALGAPISIVSLAPNRS